MAKKFFGALSWPYLNKPGCILVVKVEWDSSNPGSNYKATVIHEAEEKFVPAMFKVCYELQKKYEIDLWHGDAMNEPMVDFLFKAAEGKSLPLGTAPYVDKPDASVLYLQVIRELTRNDNKALWFGESSSLPGHLTNLPKDKPIDISHYPPVAALGYVAAALHLWSQPEYDKKLKSFFERIIEQVESPESEWDTELFGRRSNDDDDDDEGGGFFPE
jgi:hypothetical protein